MNEIEVSVNNYSKAFKKLAEGVEQAQNELDRDGVIQRFEFTFELFSKTLKLILEYEGFSCNSPRSCIKEAQSYTKVFSSLHATLRKPLRPLCNNLISPICACPGHCRDSISIFS